MPFRGPDGEAFVTVIVKATYMVSPEGRIEIADDQIPIVFGDIPYDDENGGSIQFEADIAPFKPRADIVLVGHAYAPPGKTVQGMDVSLRVGDLHRVLRIFGDRQWHISPLTHATTTEPKPFTRMPIIYERAYGGIDLDTGSYCRENPIGVGHFGKPTKKIAHQQNLPNIEDPKFTIQNPKDHPKPVGFGFYGRAWYPRVSYLGTYDEHWRKTKSPDPPADFKYDYYNCAHPDLQLNGYLSGGEPVVLINLTERQSMVQFELPKLQLGAMVEKSGEALAAYLATQGLDQESTQAIRERSSQPVSVRLNIDTLCLIPDDSSFFMLCRGRIPVYDLTAIEISTIEIT